MHFLKPLASIIFTCLIWSPHTVAKDGLTTSEFAPASRSEDSALFTKREASETGLLVENAYDDPTMWQRRYRAFMGGGMGSGVAAGDFDQDGKVDLYVSTKTRPGRLFRNLGNWKFEDVTEEAGLSEEASLLGWLKSAVSSEEELVWRQGAVFADVDNDGLLDLYVCRNNAPNLLYMNQGDGTFEEEAEERGLAIVDGSVVGAFADYDRDGWLDALVLTNQVDGTEPGGRKDRLFRNEGKGYFTETTEKAGIMGVSFGHSATWVDYDDDLWPDLYIANDFAGPDYFYRNNRDGTFTNVLDEVAPHTPYSSMGADTGDINNDGHIDILVADMATTTREKDRRGLAASREDVLMMGTKEGTAPQYMRNALLLNTGTGVFREAACWAGIEATDWTWSVRFEDFDNDGWADLHVTNGMVREANNSDLLARMMRALSDIQRISVMKRSPPLEESNLAYRNLNGEGFEPVTKKWGLEEIGITFGAATADFDNDGDLDLAYLNYNGGLSVYRNDVVDQNRIQVRLIGTQSNRFGIGATVTLESAHGKQVRNMTVARGYASGSEVVAHFGLGSERSAKRLIIEWPSGYRQVFEDLTANRAYLISEADTHPASEPAPILFAADSEDFGLELEDRSLLAMPDKEQVFLPFRTDRRGPGIAVADVDGDDRDDLYLSATSGSPAQLLLWREGAYVATPLDLAPSEVEDGPPLLVDVDGNGSRDLLITKASADAQVWPQAFQPVLYANDGAGRFTATKRLPDLSMNVGAACAADVDGDGDLDLFLGARSIPGRYPDTPRSALLLNDNGRFTDASADSPELANAGLVKSALFRDVDQDGLPDLVVALEWDFVRYFHNEGDGAFSDRTEELGFASGGKGWWNGLASGDFNGDGRPDFAAGNLGLNTTYEASPEQPATLFYGDLAQNGTKLIAEAVYDGNELYPVRARSDIGLRLPFVLRAYPKNDDYARATMTDVFGAETLQSAERFTADNFSSGAFLSQPDGTYRFRPFPSVAQIGPIQGLVAADLDGDGLPDLCATQNTASAIPRFHGGVGIFLKGRGDGSFAALAPEDSGVVVTGSGRAITVLDPSGEGRPDLFLTRHGGSSKLLANQARQSPWLTLRLQGSAANPDAVGAQVRIRYANGDTSHHEIGIGGGWLTQEPAQLFIPVPREGGVEEASVRWPGGAETTHRNAPDKGVWTLRAEVIP